VGAKRTRKELARLLKEVYEEQFVDPGYWSDVPKPDNARCDPRYGVKHYIGDVRDETGQRYMVMNTGDARWYLFHPLLGETTIAIGNGFPVEKKSLPPMMRRALVQGWCNGVARAPQRAVITYGPEDRPIDASWVWSTLEEARGLQPSPAFLVFAAYDLFDEAIELIQRIKTWDGITLVIFNPTKSDSAIPTAPIVCARSTAHTSSEFKPEEVDRYVADFVVCALRMANTCPGRTIDLQNAVEKRIEDKNQAELRKEPQ
jgi:hypothetical protein